MLTKLLIWYHRRQAVAHKRACGNSAPFVCHSDANEIYAKWHLEQIGRLKYEQQKK